MLNTDFTTPLSTEEIDARLDTIARQIVGRRLRHPRLCFWKCTSRCRIWPVRD